MLSLSQWFDTIGVDAGVTALGATMWLTGEVDLPAEVLEAHRAGRLVLFVGAGASMDDPSNLKSFGALVSAICDRFPVQSAGLLDAGFDDDVVLGRLASALGHADGFTPVHEEAKRLLSDPSSLPNDNHSAIARIAASAPALRIVTTNFDDHLAHAASDLGVSVPTTYFGPALPLGRAFTGLVHLHGSITRPAAEFVLTDADFGSAYLAEAWASRFLYNMFAEYVVLFIGYSHSDVTMSYLARGLPSGQRRYALTSNADPAFWDPLNITPVSYPASGNDHSELTRMLRAWADHVERGPLADRERVRDIVSAPVTADPVELDLLRALVGTVHGAQAFAEFAAHPEWVDWAVASDVFRPNFGDSEETDAARILGNWVADQAASSPELSTRLLRLLERRPELSRGFWVAIARSVRSVAASDPALFATWTAVLFGSRFRTSAIPDWTGLLLGACTLPTHRAAATVLWEASLRPELVLEPAFDLGLGDDDGAAPPQRRPSARLRWPVKEHAVRKAWQEVIHPNVATIGAELGAIAERALRSGYALLAVYNGGAMPYDPLSFRRSAIEPHAQDRRRSVEDLIIDILRDTAEHAVAAAPDAGLAQLRRWLDDELAIFRRLALDGIRRGPSNADSHISLIIDRGMLFDPKVWHEARQLLRSAVPEASAEARTRLIAAIQAADLDDRHAERRRFDLLAWLLEAAPDWAEARVIVLDIRSRHPEYRLDDHSDFTIWTSGGGVTEHPPFEDDAFAELIDTDPRGAVAALVTGHYSDRFTPGQASWEDACSQVTSTVAAVAARGVLLWDELPTVSDPTQQQDLRVAVIRGWAYDSHVEAKDWAGILDRLRHADDSEPLLSYQPEVLLSSITRPDSTLPHSDLPAAIELAEQLWQRMPPEPDIITPADWLTVGLNSADGKLTSFFIHAISRLRTAAGEDWNGLDTRSAAWIRRPLTAGNEYGGARAILGSELRFLFHSDEELIVNELFAAMNPEAGEDRALQLWTGYLYSARWDLRMIARGLPMLLNAFAPYLHKIDEDLQQQYFRLAIATAPHTSTETRPAKTAIATLLGTVGADLTSDFLTVIGYALDSLAPDETSEIWNSWLRTLLDDLASGTPVNLNASQWAHLAGWLQALGPHFPDGVKIFLRRPAGLGGHGDIGPELLESPVIDDFPQAAHDFVLHLLTGTTLSIFGTYYLEPIVRRLRANLGADAVTDLVEQAVRLGHREATQWLQDDPGS